MRVPDYKLKKFLLDAGLISAQRLARYKKGFQDLGEWLVEEGVLTKDRLAEIQAYILGIPFVNLEKQTIDPKILRIIPEAIARAHNIVAYRKKGKVLEVATTDPKDLQTIDFIKKKSNLEIQPSMTSQRSIESALQQYQKSLEAEFNEIVKKETESLTPLSPAGKKISVSPKALEKKASEMPIIKIVDTLIKHAIIQNVSDIHIEPEEKDVLVRYRIDGVLRDAMVLPKAVQEGIIARIKVLAKLKLDEHRLPQDGRFKIETDEYKVAFRVSVLPVYDGEKVVIRLLREDVKGLTLEKLGLRAEALEKVYRNIKRPNGLILITGPTGSGKTTTLYTIMNILNKPTVNISTVEDPIEYRMPRINQTQVRPDIGLTFANGLRSLVRQDPDIIMVGEIRDNETAALAIHAALTGHLVLSTLHTNSAAGALPRLLDMKVEAFLIASTARLIIAQRLVRKLCSDAKEKYFLKKEELSSLKKQADMAHALAVLKRERAISGRASFSSVPFFRPGASKTCEDGYKGRIGIFEALEVSQEIKKLINKEVSADRIHQQAVKEGMITMFEDGLIKAVRGITSLEEVVKATRQ